MGNYWVKLRYRKDPHMILPQLAYKIISQQITSCFPFKNWLLVSLLFGYPIFGNEQRMIHRRWWWWCWRWWWRQWLLLWQVEEEEGGWLWSLLISGLEHFLCFYILGISSSQLTKSYFSEGYVQTTNQLFSHVLTWQVFRLILDGVDTLSRHREAVTTLPCPHRTSTINKAQ